MYFTFTGPLKEERLKVPDELITEIPEGLSEFGRNDFIFNHIICNDKYYYRIIPRAVAEFLQEFYINWWIEGPAPFYDEMKIKDTVICVVGNIVAEKPHTKMFAYRKDPPLIK
ncbi:MAG: hypothetical protein ACOC5R_06315 [Elusimicrobiota bacterium]